MWGWLGSLSQQSGNAAFPYTVGDVRSSLNEKSIWKLHDGRKQADGTPVSIFVFEKAGASEDLVKLARSSFFRLKTLRHPNVLRYVDSAELDTKICVVTECVVPLEDYLADNEGSASRAVAISWGLHQVAKGIGFLNMDCSLCHGALCMASVFVDAAGEWKIGGVDYLHTIGEVQPEPMLPYLKKYQPPGGKGADVKVKWAIDVWGLGCLAWEVFNQPLPQLSSLKTVAKIPKNLIAAYCELVSANPRSRPSPTAFLANCRKPGGFMANDFVDVNLQLEEVQILDAQQKEALFAKLKECVDSFPDAFNRFKVLPILLQAFEFGEAGSAVLAPLFKLGKLLETAEYQQKIVPCVVKLFSSTDRNTRINLLQQLDLFVEHLQPAIVNDKIFQHVALGFSDTVAVMREHTIKSMLLLAPKLSEKTMNGELLRHFAKLQMDEQPGIRTNTTICLGKLACHLSSATRQKVLISAFLRALRDPFPPARLASVRAMLSCVEYFSDEDMAARLLPAVCPLLTDKEKPVRDAVIEAAGSFLRKLEESSARRADETAETGAGVESGAGGSSSVAAAGAAATASWAGWAVTSLTSKLMKQDGSVADGASSGVAATAAAGVPSGSSMQTASNASAAKPVRQPSGSQSMSSSKRGGSDGDGDGDGGWGDDDDDNWDAIEDSFTGTPAPKKTAKSGSSKDDSAAWDEDGWGSFDSTPSMSAKSSSIGLSTKGASTNNSSTSSQKRGTSQAPAAVASSSSSSAQHSSTGKSKSGAAAASSSSSATSGWGDDDDAGDGWNDDNADWGSLEESPPKPAKTLPVTTSRNAASSSSTGATGKGGTAKSNAAMESSTRHGFVKDDSMPTAASLFTSSSKTTATSSLKTASKPAAGAAGSKKKSPSSSKPAPAAAATDVKDDGDGWGGGDDWGDLGDGAAAEDLSPSPSKSPSTADAADRTVAREQRRAEQRKKQEALKAKRAAAAKQSKLGGAMKLS